jgi:hypothetical protein
VSAIFVAQTTFGHLPQLKTRGTFMLTVPLTRPITVKGETVNSLTFREPDMGDLIAGETIGKGVQTATILATLHKGPWLQRRDQGGRRGSWRPAFR